MSHLAHPNAIASESRNPHRLPTNPGRPAPQADQFVTEWGLPPAPAPDEKPAATRTPEPATVLTQGAD